MNAMSPESTVEAPADEADLFQAVRVLEALLFAASEPVAEDALESCLPNGCTLQLALEALQKQYHGRGVQLVCTGGRWWFRTADDLTFLLRRESVEERRLSRAALETLSIIAYHQPVTRAEIEEIRGVSTSKGTIDVLLATGWIRLRGRRRTPGRPVTYGTTDGFLDHFGLEAISDLPGMDELKGAGLLDSNLPANIEIPVPGSGDDADDEDPLEDGDDLFEGGDAGADDDQNGKSSQ